MIQLANKKKNNFSHILPLFFIGAGLIVLGLVAAKFITANGIKSDFSVVPAQVNFPAPDLSLTNLAGENVSISDYAKQIVLINNWATWCPPCRDEMPTLSRYYKKHKEEDFVLIGIDAGDPADEVENFAKEYKLTFPILLDPNNRSLIAFRNDSLRSSSLMCA